MLNNLQNIPRSVRELILRIVKVAQPKQLVLFGSRARGDHRANSDIDLAVVDRRCTDSEWSDLLSDIADEPFTLYSVDLVDFENLAPEFKNIISREGRLVYERHDKL